MKKEMKALQLLVVLSVASATVFLCFITKVNAQPKTGIPEPVIWVPVSAAQMPAPEPAETPAPEPVAQNTPESPFSENEMHILAKTLYGEANCVPTKAEKAMVVWCILNRYDVGSFGTTISEICSKPMQFTGYDASHPVTEENLALVNDVIERWLREKSGEANVGRTLPQGFCYFYSDSNPAEDYWHNMFYKYANGNQGAVTYCSAPTTNPY